MFSQFFGKPFWITLAAHAIWFLVAIAVFQSSWSTVAVLVLALAAFATSLWRMEVGLTVAFAELFANSHGHLIDGTINGFVVSSRMAVFVGVMAGYVIRVLLRRSSVAWREERLWAFFPLLLAVVGGMAVGWAHNDHGKVFADANAYFYLAYLLPILSVTWDGTTRRLLLQVFAASASWVGVVTLGLLYIFTHFPEWLLGRVYEFVRDTRTGELTKMRGHIFRIFLQAQLSDLVLLFLTIPFLFLKDLTKKTWWQTFVVFTGCIAVILLSLSRSFWIGIMAATLVYLDWLVRYVKPSWRDFGRGVGMALGAGTTAMILLVGVVLFPYPYRVGAAGDLTGLFTSRATDVSDVAVSSRWKLLGPLLDEIKESPLEGKGFGEEVTFQTDDPRVRAFFPDGTWTTYSLEWGWLELWLKMGLLGPLAFAFLFGWYVWRLWPGLGGERGWLAVGLLASVVSVFAIHIFSPYLNHPLGLGLLLFVLPFLNPKPPIFLRIPVVSKKASVVMSPTASVLTMEHKET
jgi:O-antigen ligase